MFARALTGTVQYSSLEKAVEQEDWKVSDNFTVGCWTSSPCLSVVTCETIIIRPLLPTLQDCCKDRSLIYTHNLIICESGDYFPSNSGVGPVSGNFKMVRLAQAGERDVSTLYKVSSFIAILLPCWIWVLIFRRWLIGKMIPVPQSLLGFVIIPERRFETIHLSFSATYWASSSQLPTDFKQVLSMEQSQGIRTWMSLSGLLSDPERTLWSQWAQGGNQKEVCRMHGKVRIIFFKVNFTSIPQWLKCCRQTLGLLILPQTGAIYCWDERAQYYIKIMGYHFTYSEKLPHVHKSAVLFNTWTSFIPELNTTFH